MLAEFPSFPLGYTTSDFNGLWNDISYWETGKYESHSCCVVQKVKKADIALPGNPISELRSVTYHAGSHSVTCHPTQVNAPRQTSAIQAGTRFNYPGGMEG